VLELLHKSPIVVGVVKSKVTDLLCISGLPKVICLNITHIRSHPTAIEELNNNMGKIIPVMLAANIMKCYKRCLEGQLARALVANKPVGSHAEIGA
jgi:hypothetical protein